MRKKILILKVISLLKIIQKLKNDFLNLIIKKNIINDRG